MIKEKILIVGGFPPKKRKIFGGIVASCNALVNSKLGSYFEIITFDSTQISNPPPKVFIRFFLAVKRFINFILLYEKKKPEVVLIFSSHGLSLLEKGLMARYARLRGSNSLLFPRSGKLLEICQREKIPEWIRFSFYGASKILCQGKAWQDVLVSKFNRLPEEVPIVSNWTATEQLIQIGMEKIINRDSLVNFIFVGWLEDHKGIFELIEACNKIKDEISFKLRILGNGHAHDEAERKIREYGLADSVELLGWREGDELYSLYGLSDVFILPSWHEGLPNSMIEAMACKLAVIVTDVGSIPDYIIHEKNGVLIQPKNVDQIVSAMKNLINDYDLRSSIAVNGHEFAKKEWSVDNAVKKIIEVSELNIIQ